MLSLLHSMLCYKIFMSLSINDYWQLSAAVAVYVALQRSRSINRNWNTSQGFPKRMPQATIAASFPQSEGRARWAISPHCRETNGQIKKHRQKATAQEQRQRQSSIDLKRNSSEVLTANYTKCRTSRSPRAIMKLPTPLSLYHRLQLPSKWDPQQCNAIQHPLCLLLKLATWEKCKNVK